MSAAVPLPPPPGLPPRPTMNGYGHGGPSMGFEGWIASEGVGDDGRGPTGAIAHISDIFVVARGRVDQMEHASVC
jgi:hypothetical protein